jgi:hypothetical protein
MTEPAAITEPAATDALPIIRKSRHKGHQPYNNAIREDQLKYIRTSPENFEALLYLPVESAGSAGADEWLETAKFSRPDTNQAVLSYQDPITVCVLEQPSKQDQFDVEQSGDDLISDVEEFLMVFIDADAVPVGAALEWEDELSEGETRRTWWYVHHISSLGSTKAGATYYLIPLKDFTGLNA